MSSQSRSNIFVYGTLKRGQLRERQWPCNPIEVRPAWTLGRLYDTGPFPALIRGEDRVAGQLWSLRSEDLDATLRVLDTIEGTNQPGVANDYDRVETSVWLKSESIGTSMEGHTASIYRFALLDLIPNFVYLPPSLEHEGAQFSIWPQTATWE